MYTYRTVHFKDHRIYQICYMVLWARNAIYRDIKYDDDGNNKNNNNNNYYYYYYRSK